MRPFYIVICIVLGAALFLSMSPALAAGSNFSISGQVVDALGNPVQGADVTLIDYNYHILGINTTNQDGDYDFVNVVSDVDTVTVRVNLTRDGVTYEIPAYYTLWYQSKGIQYINSSQTQFPNYPPPTAGYAWGAITLGNGSNASYVDGDVYLISVDTGQLYQQYADVTDGKESFSFNVPVGAYDIYAVHEEYGLKSASPTQRIMVNPAWLITDSTPTVLHIQLGLKPPEQTATPMPTSLAPPPQVVTPMATAVPASGIPGTPLVLAIGVGVLSIAGIYLLLRRIG